MLPFFLKTAVQPSSTRAAADTRERGIEDDENAEPGRVMWTGTPRAFAVESLPVPDVVDIIAGPVAVTMRVVHGARDAEASRTMSAG